MASIYSRDGTSQLWLKFRHPMTGETVRLSLDTGDTARAEIIRQKVEAWSVLNSPRTAHIPLPALFAPAAGYAPSESAGAGRAITSPESSLVPPPVLMAAAPKRVPVATVASAYADWCRAENSAQHACSKIGYLRRFFGEEVVPGSRRTNRGKGPVKPFCRRSCLEDISVDEVIRFIHSVSESTCTRRHLREMMHQLWEVALKRDLLAPVNYHTPNPMAALPSYSDPNRIITYLDGGEIDAQFAAVQSSPPLHAGVSLMIHGGLRRNEAVWLRRRDVHLKEGFFSVLYKADNAARSNSLKTGQRSVTLTPTLRAILEPILALDGPEWLVPNAAGRRCNKDNFSEKLREANAAAGLDWTCNEFRHTFATVRLAEGMSIFHLSKEMGTSVTTLMRHYAAFVRPDHLFRGFVSE